MKLIGLEEHFSIPNPSWHPQDENGKALPPLEANTMIGAPWLTHRQASSDISARLAFMDEHDISTQVLSTPFSQGFPAACALDRTRELNDYAASLTAEHPMRFAAFASLPTSAPAECAAELERTVRELGFVGALVANRVNGCGFLDAPEYDDLLCALENLDVPLYLHPGEPPAGVRDQCYTDARFTPGIISVFSRYGFGWHVDVAIHFLHLVLTGTFDRHPKLQIIMGHWGELLPFYIDRFDTAMPREFTGLTYDVSHYLKHNLYVTSSGVQTPACMTLCKEVLGADRLMFSADYPFASPSGTELLTSNPSFTAEEIEAFAHGNAERLLKLSIR